MRYTGSLTPRLGNDRYFPQDDGYQGADTDTDEGRGHWRDDLSDWALEGVDTRNFPVEGVTLVLNEQIEPPLTEDGTYHSHVVSGEIAFEAMLDGQISVARGMELV